MNRPTLFSLSTVWWNTVLGLLFTIVIRLGPVLPVPPTARANILTVLERRTAKVVLATVIAPKKLSSLTPSPRAQNPVTVPNRVQLLNYRTNTFGALTWKLRIVIQKPLRTVYLKVTFTTRQKSMILRMFNKEIDPSTCVVKVEVLVSKADPTNTIGSAVLEGTVNSKRPTIGERTVANNFI